MTPKLFSVIIACCLLAGLALSCAPATAPIELPANLQKTLAGGTLLFDQTIGDNRIVVVTFDGPPKLLRENCIKGDALGIWILNRRAGKQIFQARYSETDPEIIFDFSKAGAGEFTITECTFDSRVAVDETVPFLRRTLSVAPDGSSRTGRQIVLEGQEADEEQIDSLKRLSQEILYKGDSATDEEVSSLTDNLLELRNIAIDAPQAVIPFFEANDKKIRSADLGLDYILEEIKVIKELKATPTSSTSLKQATKPTK